MPNAVFCVNYLCPGAFILEDAKSNNDNKKYGFNIFNKPEIDFHRVCPICEINQCLKCGREHDNISCKKNMKFEKKKNDSFLKEKRTNNLFKKCPRCKFWIEKNDGCDHMSCKKCQYEFSWKTLRRWPP